MTAYRPYKTLFGDEWVRVENFMNKNFPAAGPCSICRTMKAEPVWFNVKTKVVKCMQCVDGKRSLEKFKVAFKLNGPDVLLD